MKASTATLLAALVGGGLALAGLFVERFLRSLGRLWFVSSGWDLTFSYEPWSGHAGWVDYEVTIDLFNGKEIPVGMRAVSVVFTCDRGAVTNTPSVPSRRGGGFTFATEMSVINIPPRQWLSKELVGQVGEDDPETIRLLEGWRRVEFVAQRQRRGLFERKEFRRTLASRPPYSDPWKREL